MNIRLIAFLVILTVLRLVTIGTFELSPDEAYYQQWSQRLDTCYFSKGPGVALAIRAGTAMFGDAEFGVRFFAPLLALGTSLLLFALARRIYDERVATWTVVLANATPLFNGGGLLMTIDPLSIFFWAAALYTLWRALEKSPAFSAWWPASGLLIGMGFLCKWTNAVQLLSVLLLLALTPRYRHELRRPGFWSMLLAFLPALWPVWVWQDPRGWPVLHHLSARGGLETAWWKFDWRSFGGFFGLHFIVYSPIIFTAMLGALWLSTQDSLVRWGKATARCLPAIPRGLRRHPLATTITLLVALSLFFLGNAFDIPALHSAAAIVLIVAALAGISRCKEAANLHWKSRFLIAFSLPLVVGYAWIALHHDSEVNWTAPASVSLLILTVEFWIECVQSGPMRRVAIGGIALGAAITSAAVVLTTMVDLPYPARLRGWQQTAQVVGEVRKNVEQQLGRPVFLIAENYGVAGSLCHYLDDKRIESPGHPAVYVEESPVAANQFHFWGRYDEYQPRTGKVLDEQEDSAEYGVNQFAGRTALYITTRDEKKPPSTLIRTFDHWEIAGDYDLKQGGKPLRKIRIFICHRYKPGMLLD